ncbi:MAG TPA: LptF/LptG family permease [Saprospiraceae bacterium]|nr:LptF/LptG family permease [Saprospiraceae bacterium]
MKKIDKLLITSFIGPFAVSFGIALFVLIMQFLWLYIDEIAGKGVNIFIMLELIGYLSISTFPMALPIAVLIASVMVMGNLAERYELSSMKSAGVSLLRIMRGLIIWAAATALFSYVCSDIIIPISNLQFKSRLTDIRKQKPALALEKGIFNEDFRQFVIRIGDKARDGETISDVMIEDQTNAGKVNFNQILADSGQMYTTDDRRYFVMNLFRGTQYQEPGSSGNSKQKQRYPFIRTNFQSWTKVWDMKEFELVRSDEDRYSANRAMLSMHQLRVMIDSLDRSMQSSRQAIAEDLVFNLKRQPLKARQVAPPDSTQKPAQQADVRQSKIMQAVKNKSTGEPAAQNQPRGPKLPVQELTKPISEYDFFYETFKQDDRPALLKEAANRAKSSLTAVETRKAQIEGRRLDWVKTGYELYIKYSFALVCFIFLFIGAPMGAIIRKGGFGYPILVSIIFFVTFIMLTILCRKLAEGNFLSPFWAAMVPCIVLIPIGAILTRKGMNDSQMFSTDRIERFLRHLRNRFQKQNTAEPA